MGTGGGFVLRVGVGWSFFGGWRFGRGVWGAVGVRVGCGSGAAKGFRRVGLRDPRGDIAEKPVNMGVGRDIVLLGWR